METSDKVTSYRKKEIADKYLEYLDKHICDMKSGKAEELIGVRDFAAMLFITPAHFSDTIKEVLGKSPCGVYQEKLVEVSKELIGGTNKSISEIAAMLTYDSSNFTKFFKKYTNLTPKQFRVMTLANGTQSEKLTI